MPISATGRCNARGFTLIELLVALVILGVLATSVVLVLPDPAIDARRASLHAWQQQAETAALQASAEARPWAWEIGSQGARLLTRTTDGWRPATPPVLLPLAPGLVVTTLEINGQPRPLGSRIVFAGPPPLFSIQIDGPENIWQLAGQPSGLITLEPLR
jgi:prepilin-type N-terminal cleavage/methylation domain-containing protein